MLKSPHSIDLAHREYSQSMSHNYVGCACVCDCVHVSEQITKRALACSRANSL